MWCATDPPPGFTATHLCTLKARYLGQAVTPSWACNALHLCIVKNMFLLLQKQAEETNRLLNEFADSFAAQPESEGPKAFIRGEVIQPGQHPSSAGLQLHHSCTSERLCDLTASAMSTWTILAPTNLWDLVKYLQTFSTTVVTACYQSLHHYLYKLSWF